MKYLSVVLATSLTVLAQAEELPKSRFVQTKLPGGISLDVPKDWSFAGPDQKRVLQTYAQSLWDLTKMPYGRAGMLLGATAPADAGYVSITVSLEYRSVASQDQLKQLSASQLAGIDEQNRKDVEAGSAYNGLKVLSWEGTSVERVGSLTAMVKRYTYQLPGEEPRHMENCEFFLGNRLISLLLQHGEHTLIPTKPIFERVKASVAIN